MGHLQKSAGATVGISDVQKTTSSQQMPREQGEIECQECFELTEL